MTQPDPDALTGMKYLMWALAFIEKTGDQEAAGLARLVLEAMRERTDVSTNGESQFVGKPHPVLVRCSGP